MHRVGVFAGERDDLVLAALGERLDTELRSFVEAFDQHFGTGHPVEVSARPVVGGGQFLLRAGTYDGDTDARRAAGRLQHAGQPVFLHEGAEGGKAGNRGRGRGVHTGRAQPGAHGGLVMYQSDRPGRVGTQAQGLADLGAAVLVAFAEGGDPGEGVHRVRGSGEGHPFGIGRVVADGDDTGVLGAFPEP